MPEHEFEIYLSLLGKLLKLSPAQKAAISDEFRDHLEERLSGLIQSGMTREEAIRTAMDEFGDVNGLAIDLTRASRTPLRTVAFRSTIVASIVAVAIVGWITLFVPEHRIAAPPAVQAEHKESIDKSNVAAPVEVLPIQDDELFPEFLTKQTDVNFEETPLQDACRKLESIHGIPVVLQKSGLADAGISVDSPVNLKLTGLTFEEVLNHLARKLNITWQVHGGLVQITTQDKQKYLTRQYDLHALANQGHKLGTLMSALYQMTGDESCKWEPIDGEGGTLTPVGKTLIVRQTFKSQRKIARLLKTIQSPNPSVMMLDTCSDRDHLLNVLREKSSVDVTETPVNEVIHSLAEQRSIPILFDERILADEGVHSNSPVTLNLKDRPLSTILEFLLDDLHLTFQVRDGVVRISTEDGAQNDMTIVAYNVSDLISTAVSPGQLMTAILHSNSDDHWEITDGNGGRMVVTNVGNCLLVLQTDRVHAKIGGMLNQLRNNRREQETIDESAAPEPKMITKDYRMPKEVAANLMTALPKLVSPGKWADTGRDDSPAIEMIASKPQIRTSLVIRQTPEIHRQIKEFLQKLNVEFIEGTTFQKTDGFSDGVRGFQGGGMGGFGGGMGGSGIGGGASGGMGGGRF